VIQGPRGAGALGPWAVALVAALAVTACRPGDVGELECAAATTAPAGGLLPSLDSVPQGRVVSAVLVWRSRVPREAVRRVRDAGGTVAHEYTAQPALLVSATGAQLRRLHGTHPDADLAFGVGGTREICVVRAYTPPAADRLTAAKQRVRALAKRLLGRG
jgi:hypothetical protein